MATNYRLELDHVHCDRRQDVTGRDELQIKVDGSVLFGGNGGSPIGRGDRVPATGSWTGYSRLFTDDADVQLVEIDSGSNPDDLGTYTVDGATDVNQGVIHRVYTRNNAEYRLGYRVVPA
jgi:hypothetical protein